MADRVELEGPFSSHPNPTTASNRCSQLLRTALIDPKLPLEISIEAPQS
jgi:hypothetical protein